MKNRNKKSILLVEDEAIIALAEKMQLEKYNYSVRIASTGEQALQFIKKNSFPFDLILMDIDLGDGIDGTQVAELILECVDVPILFLSSHTESEIVEKTEKITSYGYVVKNTGIIVLDASIKMALKLFAAKMEMERSEQEIKKQAKLLDVIFNHTLDSIVLLDKDYNFIKVSETYAKSCQRDSSDFAGYNHFELYPSSLKDEFDDASINKQIYQRTARPFDFPDHPEWGTTYWNLGLVPILDSAGEIELFLFTLKDITNQKRAEDEIEKQLTEKDILLREVHHRVKNNINSIEKLLMLQSDTLTNPEARKSLHNAISRIQAMRVLYDNILLGKDFEEISIKHYLENLIQSIFAIYDSDNQIHLKQHISDFNISSKKAISIGIIMNELLTNVFNHAFKDIAGKAKLSVSIHKSENMISLNIQDNGTGTDKMNITNSGRGFGHTIVHMLVEQLNGTFAIENKNGTECHITFPLDE